MSVTMRPPAAVGTVQGYGQTYSPDASGNYAILFYKDVQSLAAAGWSIVAVSPEAAPDYVVDLTGILPSATGGTYGAVTNLAPALDYPFIKPLSMDLVFGSVSGETVTVQLVVTYSDGTTTTITSFTASSSSTTALTNAQLRGLYKTGVVITNIAINCKSSIGSSTATLEVKSHGIQ